MQPVHQMPSWPSYGIIRLVLGLCDSVCGWVDCSKAVSVLQEAMTNPNPETRPSGSVNRA